MSKLVDSINQIIHEASTTLIDSQVTDKAADAASTLVTAAFDVVDQVLHTVQELTAPDEGA